MATMFKCLPNPFCSKSVEHIDRRHGNLHYVPDDILKHHKTLEELFLDSNQLSELPKGLYKLVHLRRLTISDNEIDSLSPEIGCLVFLQEFNCSRNELQALPEEIRLCESLQILDVSGNPLQDGLPAGITELANLSHLTLNDCSLAQLPEDIGRLRSLRCLEVRENLLRCLPKTLCNIDCLISLDLGNNELCELPQAIGKLKTLKELWLDVNELSFLPDDIGLLENLQCLDVSSNRISLLPNTIGDLSKLTNLELGSNRLREIPGTVGKLKELCILKVDCNQLSYLPEGIGGCTSLSDLVVTDNLLQSLPDSIGNLKHLQNLNADKNLLSRLPETMVGCEQLGILSLRYNRICRISPALGQLQRLRVLDVTGNSLRNLPLSLLGCSLKAIWLSENQAQPMVRFQEDIDEQTGQSVLTCFLLPQQQYSTPSVERLLKQLPLGDHNALPSSNKPGVVKFAEDSFAADSIKEDNICLRRQGTPQPKDLRLWKKRLPVSRNSVDSESGAVRDYLRKSVGSLPDNSDFSAIVSSNRQDKIAQLMKNNLDHSDFGLDSLNEIAGVHCEAFEKISNDIRRSEPTRSGKLIRLTLVKCRSNESFGFTLTSRSNEHHHQVFVTKLSPSMTADVRVGDQVVELDGVSVSNMSEQDLSKFLMSKQLDNCLTVTLKRFDFEADKPNLAGGQSQHSKLLEAYSNSPYPIVELVIHKEKDTPIGLSIVGGVDQSSQPFDVQCRGIFVFKVQPGSLADKADVKVGDRILMASGRDISKATHQEAVDALMSSDNELKLLVRRDPAPKDLQEIIIDRGVPGIPLGMKLNGGIDGKRVNPNDTSDQGIFITEIIPGGVADKDGRLKVGMRLLAVNGHSVMGCCLEEACGFLSAAVDSRILSLSVCFGFEAPLSQKQTQAKSNGSDHSQTSQLMVTCENGFPEPQLNDCESSDTKEEPHMELSSQSNVFHKRQFFEKRCEPSAGEKKMQQTFKFLTDEELNRLKASEEQRRSGDSSLSINLSSGRNSRDAQTNSPGISNIEQETANARSLLSQFAPSNGNAL